MKCGVIIWHGGKRRHRPRCQVALCYPKYVPSLTALTVGRLTPKALAAALTEPPLSRKSRTPAVSRSPAPVACPQSYPRPRRGRRPP